MNAAERRCGRRRCTDPRQTVDIDDIRDRPNVQPGVIAQGRPGIAFGREPDLIEQLDRTLGTAKRRRVETPAPAHLPGPGTMHDLAGDRDPIVRDIRHDPASGRPERTGGERVERELQDDDLRIESIDQRPEFGRSARRLPLRDVPVLTTSESDATHDRPSSQSRSRDGVDLKRGKIDRRRCRRIPAREDDQMGRSDPRQCGDGRGRPHPATGCRRPRLRRGDVDGAPGHHQTPAIRRLPGCRAAAPTCTIGPPDVACRTR